MKKNTILFSIIAVVILSLVAISGIYILNADAQEVSDGLEITEGNPAGSSEAILISEQFVQQVNILNQVNIKANAEKLFNSEAFNSLVDFSRPIPSEPVGRDNPFAPF